MKKYIKKSKRGFFIVAGTLAAMISVLFGSSGQKRDDVTTSNDLPDLSYIKKVYADVPPVDSVTPVDGADNNPGADHDASNGNGSDSDGNAE